MFLRTLLPATFLLTLTVLTDSGYDALRINKVQVIGSHNSYKQALDPALFAMLKSRKPEVAKELEYSHVSLSSQLDLGLRALEIDVYADEKGGKYAHPKGLDWEAAARPPAYDTVGEMKKPGFKVLHVQDLDFRSNCPTFAGALKELKAWSDTHKDHYPIYITMNAKDEPIELPGATIPDKFTPEVFDQLDKAILDNLGREYVLTPDDIRGNETTLEQAVLADRWPTMKEAKGKFIFILDETGEKQAAYLQGHPSLRKRVLFVNAQPGTPESAFVILNDPQKPEEAERIKTLVKKGYMVRTRADAGTEEARNNDKTRFKAACASGAQIISTDYYYKSAFFPSDYTIQFGNGKYIQTAAPGQ